MFEASNVALQFVASIRPIVERVADRNLADQLFHAATSAALNTAEAGRRIGRDRRHRARIAASECAEAVVAAQIAAAWGWVGDADLADALALADRLQAMLWRLANPRR